jgi:hypothetical protein
MSTPVNIPFEPHYRNDTWDGVPIIGPVKINGLQPVVALASARMDFRSFGSKVLGHRLSTAPGVGEGTIAIVNAVTWEMTIPEQDLPLEAGRWDWDLETTDVNGRVKTYYKGTQPVIGDKTHG